MACFLVPAAEAVVTKVAEVSVGQEKKKNSFVSRLSWLRNMLLGGSVLLAFEHVWHGEITPFFPFLTAMSSKADAAKMFKEMGTVGVSMALLITGVWVMMVKAADRILAREEKR